jgi:hypothetical protein
MGATPARPTLSVVVVSFNPPPLLDRSLSALATQEAVSEIVVVRTGIADAAMAPSRSRAAHAKWIEGNGAAIPHLRRLGVESSSGDVVALIEDDCLVGDGWADAVLRAHQGAEVAIGGAVEPGAYRRALDWAAYFCDYVRFMLPLPTDRTGALAGNNVSYKREIVPELLAMTRADGLQEVFVHQAWHEQGKPMRADAGIVVRNEHRWSPTDVSSVPFHHGRAFGGRRASAWSTTRRVAFAAAAAALPLLHVARISQRVLSSRRADLPLVRALPWVGVFGVSWAAGECLGYLAGPGNSLEKWR